MSSFTARGISPHFAVSAEEFRMHYRTAVTRVDIDGVEPPVITLNGVSEAMYITNRWFPWIDEKLVQPKYDGVCQYMGIPSNRPSYIKDYHMIAMNRATDWVLRPRFVAHIEAEVDSVLPEPPPTGGSED